ncbi:MAG: ABC transporter substrate-binding protein, partial [Desulforhabdus sp.]|nr:ABC transporter substrate-binding protein [Desulforhabdus sp.]
MGKKSVLALMLAVSFMFIGLCSQATAADTIKIGAYLPMTGAVAAYGEMENNGISIAKEMEPEVLGKKTEVILVDTKSDKIEAANAVTLLVEKEKVFGILGEAISGNTMAGNPISEAAKVPSVSPTATNPLVNQGKNY